MPLTATERSNAELMREWRAREGYSRDDAGKLLGLAGRTIQGIEVSGSRKGDKILNIALTCLLSSRNIATCKTRKRAVSA